MENPRFEHLYDENEETGETILHELTRFGEFKVIWRMQERTPGRFNNLLRIKNNDGEFCIHLAVKLHRGGLAINLIKVLRAIGADLNARDASGGYTVLHLAVDYDDDKVAAWLCRQPQINLDARNDAGLTAYQMASKNENNRLKEIFRSAGADCEELEEAYSEESDEE